MKREFTMSLFRFFVALPFGLMVLIAAVLLSLALAALRAANWLVTTIVGELIS